MQTSGGMRREIVKSYRRRMGRAKRNPSPHAPALVGLALMGFAFALPILPGRHDAERILARPAEAAGRPTRRAEAAVRTTSQAMEPGSRAPVTARPALISGSRISLW